MPQLSRCIVKAVSGQVIHLGMVILLGILQWIICNQEPILETPLSDKVQRLDGGE